VPCWNYQSRHWPSAASGRSPATLAAGLLGLARADQSSQRSDLGVTKMQAYLWQRLAALDD
jgi:hypothetical protein